MAQKQPYGKTVAAKPDQSAAGFNVIEIANHTDLEKHNGVNACVTF
jgi:hypothetical protein